MAYAHTCASIQPDRVGLKCKRTPRARLSSPQNNRPRGRKCREHTRVLSVVPPSVQGLSFQGCSLRIDTVGAEGDGGFSKFDRRRTVFVGNLPPRCSETDLREALKANGPVKGTQANGLRFALARCTHVMCRTPVNVLCGLQCPFSASSLLRRLWSAMCVTEVLARDGQWTELAFSKVVAFWKALSCTW